MKILKESKDKVPTEYVTAFIAKGWEEVSALKAEVNAISKDFADTATLQDALNDLSDAYLVAIGRFQNYIDKKDMLTLPSEAVAKADESLKEDINIDNVTINVEPAKTAADISDEEMLKDLVEPATLITAIDKAKLAKAPTMQADPVITKINEAQPSYFCDFDEPDLDDVPLTDADIYPEQFRK